MNESGERIIEQVKNLLVRLKVTLQRLEEMAPMISGSLDDLEALIRFVSEEESHGKEKKEKGGD